MSLRLRFYCSHTWKRKVWGPGVLHMVVVVQQVEANFSNKYTLLYSLAFPTFPISQALSTALSSTAEAHIYCILF